MRAIPGGIFTELRAYWRDGNQQRLDGLDGGDAGGGGLLDGGEHVEHPVLPGVTLAGFLQQAVIVGLGVRDVAGKVEYGDVEQALLDEVEHIDDAPGAAVAIVEGMDAFELVMDQRQ
jgi:hypothetical protein